MEIYLSKARQYEAFFRCQNWSMVLHNSQKNNFKRVFTSASFNKVAASEHDLEQMSEDAVLISYTSQLPFPFNIYTSDVAIISQ